jgi:hypothetical protein
MRRKLLTRFSFKKAYLLLIISNNVFNKCVHDNYDICTQLNFHKHTVTKIIYIYRVS